MSQDKLVQITAPHFCAGLVLIPHAEFESLIVYQTPPILKYMIGWHESKIRIYCRKKNWKFRVISGN